MYQGRNKIVVSSLEEITIIIYHEWKCSRLGAVFRKHLSHKADLAEYILH